MYRNYERKQEITVSRNYMVSCTRVHSLLPKFGSKIFVKLYACYEISTQGIGNLEYVRDLY